MRFWFFSLIFIKMSFFFLNFGAIIEFLFFSSFNFGAKFFLYHFSNTALFVFSAFFQHLLAIFGIFYNILFIFLIFPDIFIEILLPYFCLNVRLILKFRKTSCHFFYTFFLLTNLNGTKTGVPPAVRTIGS